MHRDYLQMETSSSSVLIMDIVEQIEVEENSSELQAQSVEPN